MCVCIYWYMHIYKSTKVYSASPGGPVVMHHESKRCPSGLGSRTQQTYSNKKRCSYCCQELHPRLESSPVTLFRVITGNPLVAQQTVFPSRNPAGFLAKLRCHLDPRWLCRVSYFALSVECTCRVTVPDPTERWGAGVEYHFQEI